tara:strand:- start:1236 stop:1391 length:156 start_codon:yes stop_codon:yes gene_type:complete
MLASHIVQEGMKQQFNALLNWANLDWQIETDRPYTLEDYHDACAWIDRRLN